MQNSPQYRGRPISTTSQKGKPQLEARMTNWRAGGVTDLRAPLGGNPVGPGQLLPLAARLLFPGALAFLRVRGRWGPRWRERRTRLVPIATPPRRTLKYRIGTANYEGEEAGAQSQLWKADKARQLCSCWSIVSRKRPG